MQDKKVVDPKFMKVRPSQEKTRRSALVSEEVLEYLQLHGVNVSEVCRAAVKEALAKGKTKSFKKLITFRLELELADEATRRKIEISDVCRTKLESIYAELKLEAEGRIKPKRSRD